MENSKLELILASTSPRRRELLSHLRIPFQILSQNVDEVSDAVDPSAFSLEIADMKGQAVYDLLRQENPKKNYFVISADTIVTHQGKIYGKPKDVSEAREFLSELSGTTHSVYTAVVVKMVCNGTESGFSFAEESKVTFNKISQDLMERYLATNDSLDKAGAYGIQGPSLTFISKVDGCYSNVVGFPLSRFVFETAQFLQQNFPREASWFKLFAS